MVEEILYSKFKQLPLEERAQILLRNYYWGDEAKEEVKIKMDNPEGGLFVVAEPFIDAWGYLEEHKYAELIGGTPKSGPRYKITLEGLAFMDKAL